MYKLCRIRRARCALCVFGGVWMIMSCKAFGAVAHSKTYPLSEVVFRIEASSSMGRAAYQVEFDEGLWDPDEQAYCWSVADIDLLDDVTHEWIGMLTDASLFVRAAAMGEIELNVGFISGPADTDVRIMSPLVKFTDEIPESFARGRAVASITLTDGEGDGAYILGAGLQGSGIFRSFYNGYLQEGTRFSHLVAYLATEGGGTVTASQFDPMVGFRPFGDSVRDVSTEIAFRVSALDLAYAFTTMDCPEPPPCEGDLNQDGKVDMQDLGVFLVSYGACDGDAAYNADADYNQNGCIEMSDLSSFLSYYGEHCW